MKLHIPRKPDMKEEVSYSRFELVLDHQIGCHSSELHSVTGSENNGKWSNNSKTDSSGNAVDLHPSMGIN
ncbi:MAG: hypothetical protein JNJ77_07605 [Planctomycetia bacterium]|nr:hypothetical protein [Planctomycetia bacterium]